MSNITYFQVIREKPNPFSIRVNLIDYAQRYGIKAAAREFSCARNTVRKWIRRYKDKGLHGLNNHSRKPKSCPFKTPLKEEEEILRLRDSLKKVGAVRLVREFEVKRSSSTVYRIFKRNDRIKSKWKKHRKKNDLREVKARMKVFEKIQVDIKELKDIPNYYPYYKSQRLPRYQFTARDVKSGALFFAFGHTKDCVNAATFCAYLLEHLKRFKIDIKEISVQTDNDGAFVGNWRIGSSSPFKNLVEKLYKATHLRIPPSAPTYNSDVETSHARIEEELYDVEEFSHLGELLGKALTYQIYFNLIRPNTYKNLKSPMKIIEEEMGPIDPYLLVLQPIVLDDHFHIYESALNRPKRGHHVPDLPIFENSLKIVSGHACLLFSGG